MAGAEQLLRGGPGAVTRIRGGGRAPAPLMTATRNWRGGGIIPPPPPLCSRRHGAGGRRRAARGGCARCPKRCPRFVRAGRCAARPLGVLLPQTHPFPTHTPGPRSRPTPRPGFLFARWAGAKGEGPRSKGMETGDTETRRGAGRRGLGAGSAYGDVGAYCIRPTHARIIYGRSPIAGPERAYAIRPYVIARRWPSVGHLGVPDPDPPSPRVLRVSVSPVPSLLSTPSLHSFSSPRRLGRTLNESSSMLSRIFISAR